MSPHKCDGPPCLRMVDEVAELVDPYKHAERQLLRQTSTGRRRRQLARHHVTTWPPLLDQLADAVEPGADGASGPGNAIPESRPPVDLAALNAGMRIDAAVAHWLSVDLNRPLRAGTADNLRALLGHAPDLDRPQARRLCADVHRWWTWARIETTWDDPARDLGDPCPICSARALRIKPDGTSAWCTDCGEAWDTDTVGLLAGMLGEGREQRGDAAQLARRRASAVKAAEKAIRGELAALAASLTDLALLQLDPARYVGEHDQVDLDAIRAAVLQLAADATATAVQHAGHADVA